MDKRLEEYRAKKQREMMLEKTKEKISGLFHFRKSKKDDEATGELLSVRGDEIVDEDEDCDTKSDISAASDTCDNCCTCKDLIFYGLCFILWAVVYAVFIQLQFGVIYFIVSALVGMYLNTRTGKRRRNEVSAYSVFNKNCESIDGTLKAEQLERQMIYGRLT